MKKNKKFKLSELRIVALSFALIILTGALLLMLPISSKSGESTPFLDCLFTATSASCVTGLIVVDTGAYWSVFGQIVIILLIQIGGLGIMTLMTILTVFARRNITLSEMRLLTESAGNVRRDGIITMIKRILFGTLIVEGCGALIFSTVFIPEFGFGKGLYYSVFHSISAFCNAGFDIVGVEKGGAFTSLTAYNGNPIVNLTVCFLIIIGGLGFVVWDDVIKSKFRFRKFALHTKIVLVTTLLLITLGFVTFMITESGAAMKDMPVHEKILGAFFQSVTTRTAGFDSIGQGNLSTTGVVASSLLMLAGGSPGSTAGGIKTTTIAVIIMSTIASARNKEDTVMFKRKIEQATVRQAHTIAMVYLAMSVLAVMIITGVDGTALSGINRGLEDIVFEVCSAIGTVGLTTGITTTLSSVSQIILILLMYSGRIGAMSMILVFTDRGSKVTAQRPYGKVMI